MRELSPLTSGEEDAVWKSVVRLIPSSAMAKSFFSDRTVSQIKASLSQKNIVASTQEITEVAVAVWQQSSVPPAAADALRESISVADSCDFSIVELIRLVVVSFERLPAHNPKPFAAAPRMLHFSDPNRKETKFQ